MFHFVQRLAPFSKTKVRVLASRALSSHQSFTFSFMRQNQLSQIPRNSRLSCCSFSSSQDIEQNPYEADLALLRHLSEEDLSEKKALLNMYKDCKDISLIKPLDVIQLYSLFQNLGRIYKSQGNLEKAQSYLLEVCDLLSQYGWRDITFAETQMELANMYHEQNDIMKARDCYNEAIRICKLSPGEGPIHGYVLFHSLGSIAKSYGQTNEKDKVYETYRSIIESAEDAPTNYQHVVVEAYENLGLALNESGEKEKANEYLQKALEITIKKFGEESKKTFDLYGTLARVFQSQGNFNGTFYYSDKALKVGLRVFPKKS